MEARTQSRSRFYFPFERNGYGCPPIYPCSCLPAKRESSISPCAIPLTCFRWLGVGAICPINRSMSCSQCVLRIPRNPMCVCEACVVSEARNKQLFCFLVMWRVRRGRLANCVASPKPTYVRTQASTVDSSFGVTSQTKIWLVWPTALSPPLCAAEHSHQLQI